MHTDNYTTEDIHNIRIYDSGTSDERAKVISGFIRNN